MNYLDDAIHYFFVGNRLQGCRRHCSTMLVVLMMAKEDNVLGIAFLTVREELSFVGVQK